MGFDKRYEGIDEYAVRIIKYKARQLVGRVGFTESDREDLEQEMMLDLLQRLPKYNPDRAQRNTFIARVVEHKIATIIEARKAGLRDYRLCRCSLDDRFEYGEYEDSFCIERMEIIDQEDYLHAHGQDFTLLPCELPRSLHRCPSGNRKAAAGAARTVPAS